MLSARKIIIFLILIIGYSLALNSISNSWMKLDDLYINLAASAIFAIVTIFIINVFLEDEKKSKYKLAYETAKDDLVGLRNKLIMYFGNPFGYQIESYNENTINSDLSCILQTLIKLDMREKLVSLSNSDWQHIALNLILIREELNRKLLIYKDLVPPKILGVLLTTYSKFEKIDNLFSLLPDLLLKSESEWPKNELGIQQNRIIRQGILDHMSNSFRDYFIAVHNLNSAFSSWEK